MDSTGEAGQAPWHRLEGQVSELLNCRPDVSVDGFTTRSASELIADLDNLTAGTDYFVVQIRDVLVFIAEEEVVGYRLTDGTVLTIQDDTETTAQVFNDYLRKFGAGTFDPNPHLTAAVNVDTAIILNRTAPVTLQACSTRQECLNYIVRGDFDDAGHGITDVLQTEVPKFSDLPAAPNDGDVHKVIIDENRDTHGFYLYYSGSEHADYPEDYFPEHDNWWCTELGRQRWPHVSGEERTVRLRRRAD